MKEKINFKYFKKYRRNLDYLIKGILAGVMIGIGVIAFLSTEEKAVGAFIFSVGLLTVCMYGMNLYTGKIGYILNNKKDYWIEVGLGLLGNFLGSLLVGKLILLTRYKSVLLQKASNLCAFKLSDNILSIFILSFFCGILIHIAVNNYKKINAEIGKYACIFLCVMVFILCGFEHSVADMTYFTIAKAWTFKTFLYEIVMIVGNGLGAVLISWFYNLYYR